MPKSKILLDDQELAQRGQAGANTPVSRRSVRSRPRRTIEEPAIHRFIQTRMEQLERHFMDQLRQELFGSTPSSPIADTSTPAPSDHGNDQGVPPGDAPVCVDEGYDSSVSEGQTSRWGGLDVATSPHVPPTVQFILDDSIVWRLDYPETWEEAELDSS